LKRNEFIQLGFLNALDIFIYKLKFSIRSFSFNGEKKTRTN